MKTIYTAFSKHNYYARKFISAYVLEQNLLPLNPLLYWTGYGYKSKNTNQIFYSR